MDFKLNFKSITDMVQAFRADITGDGFYDVKDVIAANNLDKMLQSQLSGDGKSTDPVGEDILEKAPVEEAPVEEAPVEEAPAEEAPVEEAPAEEAPAEEAPAEEAPVEEAPVEEAPAEEAPVEEAPVEEAPVDVKPELKETAYSVGVNRILDNFDTIEADGFISKAERADIEDGLNEVADFVSKHKNVDEEGNVSRDALDIKNATKTVEVTTVDKATGKTKTETMEVPLDDKTKSLMRLYDGDGDGKLTASEQLQMERDIEDAKKAIEAKADQDYIKVGDTARSRKLSLREILNN